MRRSYRFDGRDLYRVDGDDLVRLEGDPATAVVRDLLGEVPATTRLAEEVRTLFYRDPPFVLEEETVTALLLEGLD